jgi:hypothetical protein
MLENFIILDELMFFMKFRCFHGIQFVTLQLGNQINSESCLEGNLEGLNDEERASAEGKACWASYFVTLTEERNRSFGIIKYITR